MKTNRCYLDKLSSKDIKDIEFLYDDEISRHYLGGIITDKDFLKKFETMLQDSSALHWVVRLKINHDFLGLITIDTHHNEIDQELSYQFLSTKAGCGYAIETVSKVVEYAKIELQLNKLIAETQSSNVSSIKLLQKLNFSMEQKLERFGEEQSIFALKLN